MKDTHLESLQTSVSAGFLLEQKRLIKIRKEKKSAKAGNQSRTISSIYSALVFLVFSAELWNQKFTLDKVEKYYYIAVNYNYKRKGALTTCQEKFY